MTSRAFILLVGNDGAILLPPRGAKGPPAFSTETILETLVRHPRAKTVILADTLAQDYKIETLPPVSFFDRRKLLTRRLEQAFPHKKLKNARTRKDGSFLLYAADENTPLGTWLDRIEALRNSSGRVSLLPAESASMLPHLAPETEKGWALLLSAQETGGFRQIVAKDGEIVFTRLTPPLPPLTHPDFIAETLAQDIKATRAYLLRAGLDENEPMALVALLPRPLHAPLKKQPFPTASPLLFTPEEAAHTLNLSLPLQTELSADLLHALWFQAKGSPLTSLIRPERAVAARESFLRKTSLTLASLALAAALGLSGAKAFELFALGAENQKTRGEIVSLTARIEASREKLLAEAEPLEKLRRAAALRRLYEARREGPETLLPLIDAALGPEARAASMTWKEDELALDIRLKDDGLTGPPDALSRVEITRRFDELAALLREALPQHDIAITHYPFPNLPNEAMTNKGRKDNEPLPVAAFSVRKKEK